MKSLRIILFFFLTSCFIGDELPPDQRTWEYDDPQDVGLNEQILLDLNSQITFKQFDQVIGLIIIKDDQLVFENYYEGLSRQSIIPLGRSSMTVTVAAIGIAEEKSLLSLSDKIQDHLPEYESLFEADSLKREITIQDIMRHTAGFSWNEEIERLVGNPDNNINQMVASNDWVEFILNQPMEAPPGVRYNFNSGTGTILAKVIENASNQTFEEFLEQHLLSDINIGSLRVTSDPSGNRDGGRGISLSLIDWTKFGYLVLEEGLRGGRRVIDPNFINEATTVQTQVSQSFNQGYGWRIFGENFSNSFPFDFDDVFYIDGETGQNQYIITSDNMVVSIYAENLFGSRNLSSSNQSLNLFFEITSAIIQ